MPVRRSSYLFPLALLLGQSVSVLSQEGGPSPPLLTRAEQVRQLSAEESKGGFPVRLEGVVTYIDPDNPLAAFIVIQDSTGGISVVPRINQVTPEVGERLVVEGITASGISQPVVTQAVLLPLGKTPMPEPSRRPFGELLGGVEEGNWVEVHGTVRSVGVFIGRLELEIVCEGQRAPILVRKFSQNDPKLERLIDGTVRVRGICMLTKDISKRLTKHVLLASSLADVLVEAEGPPDLFAGNVSTIASASTAPGRRLRVQGVLVERTREGLLRVMDDTGEIFVQTRQSALIRAGDRIDVSGHSPLDKSSGVLEDALVRVLAHLANGGSAGPSDSRSIAPPEVYVPVILEASKVRLLSPEDARAGYPIRIRGMVTYCDLEAGTFFVQDATGGVGGSLSKTDPPPKAGQEVELEGNSSPGSFTPVIQTARMTVLKPAQFPKPRILLPEQMSSGKEDGQWVEIEGVVRSLIRARRNIDLDIAANGGRFKAHLPDSGGERLETNIVDATVRVRGVYSTLSTPKGRALGFKLLVPRWDQVTILEQGPADAFSIPSQSLGTLLQFAGQVAGGHRVKVEGVVTCQETGEFVVIQDGKEGLYLQTSQTNGVRTGDRVEVLGFPCWDPRGMVLQDSIFRWVGKGSAPTPLRITPHQALSGEFNAVVVRMEGRVLDYIRDPHPPGLVLQDGTFVFSVRPAQNASAFRLESWREGSVVQVTGVCFMDEGGARMSPGFSLLVPSPGDLTLIQGPPRWTPQHTRLAVGSMVGLIMASSAWVFSLKARVRRQTELIRQRVEEEAALERRYRELVQDAHDLIYTHDLKGNLTSMNRAGEKILGVTREQALQLNMKQLVAPEHHPTFERGLEATLEGHSSAPFEMDVLSTMGPRKTLEVGTRPVYQAGRLVGVQGIARDITERKQSEAQRLAMERKLQESQKLESLGVMAGGIAHDFNNLLTAILGNASLAQTDLPSHSPAQSHLTEIEKASLQAADLCKQMLAYSGRSTFVLQRTDLSALIEEMRPLLRISVHKKIVLEVDLAKDRCHVEADPAQIRQVALNLVINASEAIGDQPGTIRVSTGKVRVDETGRWTDYVSQNPAPGDYAYLEVADTGCGMDAETKARIFEPFFTTKFTGRGLGLASVLGIVRGHKGGFKVSTEKGRGSTLAMLLPCAVKAAPPSTPHPVSEQEWRGEGTVLVVDDELAVRTMTALLLQSFGFRVLLAEDGFAAIEVFEAHVDEITLVLLDLTMPRLNGQEVFQRIKAIRPDARVILTSGYTEEEVASRFSADELSGILQKPFKKEELRRKLRMAGTRSSVSIELPRRPA